MISTDLFFGFKSVPPYAMGKGRLIIKKILTL